ncbi:hypothetical protein ACET3Z_007997 [Daucus carota]
MGSKRGSRVSSGAESNQLGLRQINSHLCNAGKERVGSVEEQVKEVLRHWFLLEWDMKTTLEKGNFKFLGVAIARINYLKRVINQSKLQGCLRGDEDCLRSVKRFLLNNGWWERANIRCYSEVEGGNLDDSLFQFISNYSHLVDKNVMNMVEKGDKEGIRMALNQIHYKSLQLNRKQGSNRAGDVHFKPGPMESRNSYKEALLDYEKLDLRNISRPAALPIGNSSLHGSRSVYFTGFPDNTQTKDIWKLFKQEGMVGKGMENLDEAQAIFETGIMMGLIPTQDLEASMKLIRDNLCD